MFSLPNVQVIPRSWILIAVLVIVAGFIGNTYRLAAAADRVRADLAAEQAVTAKLRAELEVQSASIENMRRQSIAAGNRARAAMAEISNLKAERDSAVAYLESYKRQANEDDCQATGRILREYRSR